MKQFIFLLLSSVIFVSCNQEIENDILIQKGIEKIEELGVDQIIIETYVRLKQ